MLGLRILLSRVADPVISKPVGLPDVHADNTNLITSVIMPWFFGLLGIVSVLIITIAGFKYVISRGEPQAIGRAKDTIIYALIGLVIAIFGYTIVAFVVRNVG